MAYDENVAERVRTLLRERAGVVEKKMFGGAGFLLHGNMCCGVWRNDLILRIGPEARAEYVGHPDVKEFDITGRPMKGWVMVKPSGFGDEDSLAEWVGLATEFAGSLPPKEGPSPKKSARKRR